MHKGFSPHITPIDITAVDKLLALTTILAHTMITVIDYPVMRRALILGFYCNSHNPTSLFYGLK